MLRKGFILGSSLLVFVGIIFLAVGGTFKLIGGVFVLGGIILFIAGNMKQRNPVR
jgi:hypothetical protein